MINSAGVPPGSTSHGLLKNRNFQFFSLQLLGWAGWVSLYALRDVYGSQPLERALLLIVDATAGFFLTTLLRYFYRSIWDRPVYVRIIGILVGSYLIAGIWQPIKNLAQFIYYDEFGAVKEFGQKAYFNGIIGYSYTLLLGWSGLYFGLKFYRQLQEEMQKGIKSESMAHEAQLRMLRYQLNPHFLFNTLNAISTLILDKETSVANQMVTKLSNFLRYSLDKDPMQKVELRQEVNTMQLYLEIEQVRFDDRLRVEFDIDADVEAALVPSMLLQPLVENSIKHAIADQVNGGKITINARIYAGDLLLEVIDDGPGMNFKQGKAQASKGVGLTNTKERLEVLYGNRQSCKFLPVLPHGLKIEIRMPYDLC